MASCCESTASLVRRFLTASLTDTETATLRAHITTCADCLENYRTSVATTAALAHERRLEQRAVERELRRHSMRRAVLEAHTPVRRPGRWRLLLYPAMFSVLMIHLGSLTALGRGLTVEPLAGRTHAGAVWIEAPSDAVRVRQGEWCATEPEARALLEGRAGNAQLEGGTSVLVERISPARVRLERGGLEVEGTWRIASAVGVVEIQDAAARVTIGTDGIVVEMREGSGRVIGANGVREVHAGERTKGPTPVREPAPSQ